MNNQNMLIRELLLYEFELGHNAAEATRNICYAKGESHLDQSTANKWFKKFRSGEKNLEDKSRSGRPRTVEFIRLTSTFLIFNNFLIQSLILWLKILNISFSIYVVVHVLFIFLCFYTSFFCNVV